MPTAVNTILRSSHRGNIINVLTAPTHERYESGLAKTSCQFYGWQGPGIKGWTESYAKVPSNYMLMNPNLGNNQIPLDVDIDICLSQNKFGQFQVMKAVSHQLQCPFISLEHTLPPSEWTNAQLIPHREMAGDVNVFISEYSRDKWGWTKETANVIHHGVDTDLFSPAPPSDWQTPQWVEKEDVVCSVVNDWMNRDWCCGFRIWQSITGWPKPIFPLNVWGSTPGLSQPTNGVGHLVQELRRSRVFLNTSLISPVPTSLLEAMSVGCAVVTTDNCMLPEIIEDGVNGFITNDIDKLRWHTQNLLKNRDLADKIGEAGRETIMQRFSMDKFVKNWNGLFRSVLK